MANQDNLVAKITLKNYGFESRVRAFKAMVDSDYVNASQDQILAYVHDTFDDGDADYNYLGFLSVIFVTDWKDVESKQDLFDNAYRSFINGIHREAKDIYVYFRSSQHGDAEFFRPFFDAYKEYIESITISVDEDYLDELEDEYGKDWKIVIK